MLIRVSSTFIDSTFTRAVALGLVYWLTVVLAIELVSPVDKIALFWPPNAIAVAALIFSSRKNWPPYLIALALAFFAARVPAGHLPLPVYFGFCAANIIEVLIVAEMVKRFVRAPIANETLTKALTVAILSSVPASFVSAFIGGVFVTWAIESATFWSASVGWFTSDLSGLLLVLPVLLTWLASGAPSLESYNKSEIIERIGIAAIFVVIGLSIPIYMAEESQISFIFPYLVFPVLIWTAMRLGIRSATAATLAVGLFAIALTYLGQGPFSFEGLSAFGQVVSMKVGLITITATTVFLAVVVTDRRQAEEALRESETRYRLMTESTGVVPWEANATTLQFTYVGPQAEAMLGYPVDDWYQDDFWPDHIHADDRETTVASCLSSLQREEDNDFEYRMIAADGQIVWLRDIVTIVVGEQGPEKLRGVLIDITERKKAEETQGRLTQAVETVPVGIALFDSDDRLVFFNSRYGELMEVMADILKPGVTFEEMIRTMVDRQPVKDACGREEEFIQEKIKHHRNPTGPFDIRREDKWLSADETRLADGSIFTIIIDITERKKAEEDIRRLAEAIEGLSENFALYGPDDRLIMCNQGYSKLNEAIPEATRPGVSYEEHMRAVVAKGLAPKAMGREEDYIRERMEQHRNPTGPYEVVRQDGVWLVHEQRVADGSTAIIATDITERKRMEEALVASEERHRHFSADVAHELRTPLAVLRSQLDNLENTETNQSLIKDVDAMSRLVSQLLAATRLDSLTVDPKDEADLHAIGTEVAKYLAPFAIKEGRSIEVTGTQDPVIVQGNDDALEMAVRNLVENALRYSARKTVVTIHVSDNPAISVIDRGRGIPPEQKKVIFQRFKRADRRSGGAGLGLSIVQRVAESHQATIDVSDTPGGGTVFKISFPSHKSLKVVTS